MQAMFRTFRQRAGLAGRQPGRHAARTSLTIQVLGCLPLLRYTD